MNDKNNLPPKEQRTHLYVAYGSNMNVEQMARRCPGSTPYDVGTIQGYSLEFNRVATICKEKGAEAPCVLWNITPEHERALDRHEGYPYKYTKVNVPVIVNGEEIKAMAYVMRDSSHKAPPKDEYFDRILEGYIEFGVKETPLFDALERAENEQEKRIEREYREFQSAGYKTYYSSDELNKARIDGFRAATQYAEYIGIVDEGTDISLPDRDILGIINMFKPFAPHTRTLSKQPADYKYYVAYGSNINLDDMARRCPHSEVVGVKMLKGYELVFDQHATIEKNNDAATPILLWKIHRNDWRALDHYEGYPSYYRKENISFSSKAEGKINATVYIMNREGRTQYTPPTQGYVQCLVEGYKANGIDLKYLNDALTKNLQQNGLLDQSKSAAKEQEQPAITTQTRKK